jgi:predicted ABC-type ATPase
MHRANGEYTPERKKLHAQIVADIVASAGDTPPGEKPTVIIMGGGSAAGKSTLRDHLILPGMAQLGYKPAIVDCDDVKEKIPEFKDFKRQDRSTAALRVHEESSDIASAATDQLVKAGKSFIMDGTMKNAGKYKRRIEQFRKAGYEVQIIIADAPLHEAFRRANARADETGREVPLDIIRESHAAVPRSLEELKGLVDDFAVFDTTGDSPGLIHSPDYTNEEKFKAFRRKGGLS